MKNVLHYEHTVATYNVITVHKAIPAHIYIILHINIHYTWSQTIFTI